MSSLSLQWVGQEAVDRVALTRQRCYSPALGQAEKFELATKLDGRAKAGDILLAARDGQDVGTATSLSLHMWIREARVACQGVAWVGTIKTGRRGGTSDGQRGIASQIMAETIRLGHERGQIVSALMPFRASFYEHFGYGNAERRTEWNVPLSILPKGDFDGYRFYEQGDDTKLLQLRGEEARRGQCDIETDQPAWANYQREWPNGFGFVDQPVKNGPIEGWVRIVEDRGPQAATAVIDDWSASSSAAFRRMLHFLASLKDQYSVARLTLPGDLPLNRLLRESQMPHRQVDHPVSNSRPYTRMQIRVLDHKRLLEAMKLPATMTGKLNLAVKESEGTTTRLTLDFDAGRCTVASANGDADATMTDVLWASIVTGDLAPSAARAFGLIECRSDAAIALLDGFAAGPAPFCQEYF
jgi:predicted acetyltransferase